MKSQLPLPLKEMSILVLRWWKCLCLVRLPILFFRKKYLLVGSVAQSIFLMCLLQKLWSFTFRSQKRAMRSNRVSGGRNCDSDRDGEKFVVKQLEGQFFPGDVTWAKLRGNKWWPAVVCKSCFGCFYVAFSVWNFLWLCFVPHKFDA